MDDDAFKLLEMFQKLGTTDHDTLIQQFRQIVPDANPDAVRFYLEASNWTLQGAILSYFDHGGDAFSQQMALFNRQKPQISWNFKDDGLYEFTAGVSFRKVWHISNTGTAPWPDSCCLNHVSGSNLGGPNSIPIGAVQPGSGGDLAIQFVSPTNPGTYQGTWMMNSGGENPVHFGDPFWVIITVSHSPLPQYSFDLTEMTNALSYQPTVVQPPSTQSVFFPSNSNPQAPFH